MDLNAATQLVIKSLVKAQEARGEKPGVKIAIIPTSTKKMENLSDSDVEKYMKSS